MVPAPVSPCPKCGAPRRGAYCTTCGAGGSGSLATRGVPRWVGTLLIGMALVAMAVAMILPSAGARGGDATDPATGTVADATPKGRFLELVGRVSSAAERGDAATARDLTQQALTTFEAIPLADRDVDSRYHAGMLRAVAGDSAGALAQADTILAGAPDNLYGYYVRGVVARLEADSLGARAAHAAFSARYSTEMTKARPEYALHREMLAAFLAQP